MMVNPDNCGIHLTIYLILSVLYYMTKVITSNELEKFTSCNNVIDMDERSLNQGELELVIRDIESSGTRVSCDFTIKAGAGRQVMFYVTDLYLGSPNRSERVDKSCIEPRDVTGHYESVPTGMRPIICSQAEVEIGKRVYATTGSGLSLRFYRNRGYSISVYFKIVFTAFRSGSCRTSERKCSNDRCISHEIVCNGHNPCGDHSDCPTGLEHLSSWAMSGIVVLALLAGGIIIIMATVCLQRSSSKRYDIDDIVSRGSVRHEHHHVEMDEVSKHARPSRPENTDHRTDKDGQFINSDGHDNRLLFHDYRHSVLEPPSENDREKLIQSKRASPDTYSDDFASRDASFKPCPNGTENTTLCNNIDMTPGAHVCAHFVSCGKNALLVPEDVAKTSNYDDSMSQEVFRFSGNSMVYSDSDSEEEEKFKVTSLDRKRQPPSYLKSSSSQNGTVCNGAHTFGSFKPPPPSYTTVHNKARTADKGAK